MIQLDQRLIAVRVGLRREGVSGQDKKMIFRFWVGIKDDDALRIGEEED